MVLRDTPSFCEAWLMLVNCCPAAITDFEVGWFSTWRFKYSGSFQTHSILALWPSFFHNALEISDCCLRAFSLCLIVRLTLVTHALTSGLWCACLIFSRRSNSDASERSMSGYLALRDLFKSNGSPQCASNKACSRSKAFSLIFGSVWLIPIESSSNTKWGASL